MKLPPKYRPIEARGAKYPAEWHTLVLTPKGWLEPITGSLAEPIIGEIIEWKVVDTPAKSR